MDRSHEHPLIRFVDLARLHSGLTEELTEVFQRVLATGRFVGGPWIKDFERDFAKCHGVEYGASCGSGTDAIMLALRACEVGEGDEVIVPALTFVATAEAIVHAGARPVIVDVDAETLLLAPEGVEAALTPKTRAVVPVHLYGNIVRRGHIEDWSHKLRVIEDAAQAHLGAYDDGAPVGTAASAACFSFYPGKNLGALGDGGMVVSSDAGVIERIERLRDHGSSAKYSHEIVGWCSRMDSIQAAFLLVKLQHLHEWNERRRELAYLYEERLRSHEMLSVVPSSEHATHHLMVVRCAGEKRDPLRGFLASQGVETGIHYPFALSNTEALSRWHTGRCPVAETAARQIVSLPMHPYLEDSEVERVCDLVAAFLTKQNH